MKEKEVTSDVLDLLESLKRSDPGKFHETVNEVMDGKAKEDSDEKKAGWRAATEKCADCDCEKLRSRR
jgi:hypothetical protein